MIKEKINLKNCIPQLISSLFKDEEYAFEAFILTRADKKLKEFILYEGIPENRNNIEINFKKKLQTTIEGVIKSKFGDKNAEYDSVEYIADNQNKFYIIPQTDSYKPFEMLTSASTITEKYQLNEIAEGIFFHYERGDIELWAFQYFWPSAITSKKNRFFLLPKGNVFYELKQQVLSISHKVDFLVVDNKIITNDIALLQSHYGFQEYIKQTANSIVSELSNIKLVSNINKVKEYIGRSKFTYTKKMLRIKNSSVLRKNKEDLYVKITTLPRWKGKFDINKEDHTINLRNYEQVENLIDLFDERYTRSDVTFSPPRNTIK